MEQANTIWKPIVEELAKSGVKLLVTLPETFTMRLFEVIEGDDRFVNVPITKEDQGIGICAGAYCGGLKSALIIANAGFMLTGYVVPTLSLFYRLPVFMLVIHRGVPGDLAFYQEYQGLHTVPMMDAMGVQHVTIDSPDQIGEVSSAFRYSQLYRRPTAALLHPRLFQE
ncbi:MAG: hypothetical protein HY675_25675 [Chloroflexi bacterium]|nr:hypothetical protein [Chloroflexota bacterium]